MGIHYRYPVAKTGIVATIGSSKGDLSTTTTTVVVALRADMDALPIHEETSLPYSSKTAGVMHACGHDAHMTMLLGAAQILKSKEASLKGTVRLLFQPAEEGGAGGDLMVKEGALKGVSAAFGLHVAPFLKSKTVATRKGTIMAGSAQFEVTIKGRGGHAAMPHLTTDPVVAAAAAVTAMQTLVSRNTSPLDSAVVSVTRLEGGQAFNIIPDEAKIGGTVRATSPQVMTTLRTGLGRVVAQVAAAHGCTGEVDWMEDTHPYYPPLINDDTAHAFATSVAGKLLGKENVENNMEPWMAGEDFAFIAQEVPSCFSLLGIRDEKVGSVHGLHTSRFLMDESVLPVGAALHAAFVLEYLEEKATAGSGDKKEDKDEL
jgi:IAA-amino acid hydrolase